MEQVRTGAVQFRPGLSGSFGLRLNGAERRVLAQGEVSKRHCKGAIAPIDADNQAAVCTEFANLAGISIYRFFGRSNLV